jgi:hypothetical protein
MGSVQRGDANMRGIRWYTQMYLWAISLILKRRSVKWIRLVDDVKITQSVGSQGDS